MKNSPNPVTVSVPDLPVGWFALSYTALAYNRLAIVGTDEDVRGAFKKDRDHAWQLSKKASAKIWVFDGDGLYESLSFPLLAPFPIIDQFPDGNWLVANSRSQGDGNARIFRSNGTEAGRIELGDGIEHIKIDEQNRIWVGWFDEGIFGNDKWSYPGLRWPPSSSGIAVFNIEGELIKHASIKSIADCYALNIFDSEAWSCTYTDFPILQMSDTEEKIWTSNLSGIRALAINYPNVLVAGGYNENINCISLVELTKDTAKVKMTWQTDLISGKTEILLLDGRANIIHLVSNKKWHRWDATEF
ncbi:MAG: hypothetical protein ABJG88_08425 [Litorimonas sp.]